MVKKYKLVILIVVIILILLVKFLWNGNIENNLVVKTADNNYSYNSSYLKFNYLPKYTIEKVPTTDGRVLVNIKMNSLDGQILLYLAITSKDLDQTPGVLMRRVTSSQYSEEIVRMGNLRGLLFRTSDKKERTVYFENGGQILEVTLTANSNDPKFDTDFQSFLDSLAWKPEGFI